MFQAQIAARLRHQQDLLKGMMLEMADGHTRPQTRNLPYLDGFVEIITNRPEGQ
jgi:hypothetical protein